MPDLIRRLKDAYIANPASALTLLPELFQAADEGKIVELPIGEDLMVDTGLGPNPFRLSSVICKLKRHEFGRNHEITLTWDINSLKELRGQNG